MVSRIPPGSIPSLHGLRRGFPPLCSPASSLLWMNPIACPFRSWVTPSGIAGRPGTLLPQDSMETDDVSSIRLTRSCRSPTGVSGLATLTPKPKSVVRLRSYWPPRKRYRECQTAPCRSKRVQGEAVGCLWRACDGESNTQWKYRPSCFPCSGSSVASTSSITSSGGSGCASTECSMRSGSR